ncbi:hypothetical protein Pmar_PMAR023328 [Perkinsus marinus ATCC 50983]|uniref:Integrase catalytic domain-containing protein n=1 Tax=Perkinsus marinus (strain ATCC 50983 / TXsc) TaxID=423536 RepID=C5KK93_PERM5|nr:hypothetical protein Pmar_PMAR023328 [Perkinsus marinus ATCC 50983]EER15005.1 hypothetical protein Pmar_PMAR023328 [Perkinsus marinus ATCC 50983]|eukprot:XP_002783209.1 hypothetical protein Pmar_PMAR023328 [Perkinsus marinus ATCC 50983]
MSTETQPGALYTDFNFLSHDSTPHKVRVMVDTGSSRSYISLKTVGPLRDSIIKLIDTKNPKTTTKKPPTEIFSGVAADGELPVLQPVSSSSQAQTTSVSSPMPDHTTTTTTSTIHSINADTTVDPPPVQPAPTSSYDLANYVADYFTTIVAYTAVGNLATHDSVADSDPCPPPDVAVDTLTVVPQPDGSFKHYHRLPWKSTARPSTSLAGVQARTEAQLRRLSSHDRQHYDDCIQDLLQRGAIRRLQPTESPHWAMCHFGVRGHALSTTPLRPVFTGTQIGKFLLRPKGNVTINVINPLLLLRTNLHYHIEDLSKAFYSMYVFADEELWLCFWYRRAWHCFTKCPMGIAPSTGFLATSIETILTDLQRHHYARPIPTITHVDDITQVFRSKEEREDTHDLNVKHFGNHNFHMNSPKRITDDSRRERALGVWIDENDAITLYSIPPLGNFDSTDYDPVKGRRPSWPADDVDLGNGNAPSEPLTVQQAFSYVCGCYDPLGLAAETTTRQRILLRQTLALGLTNNDIVPTEISAQLLQCRRHLCNMKPQPRYVTPYLDANSNPIYFACVDASSQAVGLTITARGHDRVIAHSLLVPRSKALWTVVRLELQAIILSIPYIDQFVDAFKHNDKLPRIIICSDSLVNVQRLNSIREPSGDLNNWDKSNIHKARQLLKQRGYQLCHLKGTANPADPISRGLPVQLRCDTEPKYYDSTYLQKWIINVVDSTHSATAPPCTVTSTNVTSNDANDAEGDNTNNQDNPVVVSLPQVGYSVDVLKEAQHSDPHISAIIASLGNRQQLLNLRVQLKYYFLDSDGLLRYYPHHEKLPRLQTDCPVVIPSSGARALWSRLHEAHNHPGSGSGLRRLQRLVIWHRMPRDVRRWTSQCIICLRSRRERQARNTVNQFRIKSTRPLEVINIDYCGPYHGTSGSPVALVAVCAATGFVYGRLLPDRKLSTLIHYLFLLFNENGYPSILCCDRDSTILAAVNHLASWGITVATIPAYSVRLAWWERVHRQLHDHMRCYILNQQAALQQNGDPTPPPPTYADTEKALASSIMAINETPHGPGGLGVTPNMMVHSNGNAMLPNSLVLNDTNSDEASHYVKRLILTPITDETTVQQLRQGMALSLQQYLRLARLPDLKRHDGPTRYQVPIDHPSSRLKSGDPCFYWRPRAHKLSSSWLPATFIARLPDTNFAVLEKPSGQRITEYFFNVMCIRTSEELSTAASTTS